MSDLTLPGAALPADVEARLRDALARKGPDYKPRTEHMDGDRPRHTNRLLLETSPYLLQHAHNPVNWYPWGDEAFAEARRRDVPVMVSIGYSTCHWCHVMERESFEDPEIARFLNEHFVAIKVDREERPDVDAIYMSACQALNGSGGWPLNVFLTPDREPFFAGTYFPPRDGARGPHRGFLSILSDLADVYRRDRGRVREAAEHLTEHVRERLAVEPPAGPGAPPGTGPLAAAFAAYARAFDPTFGGTRGAPKFPSHLPVRLMLHLHRRLDDGGGANALTMATLTLEKMAAGGMYDQLGGGFHRYSTDARWLVPHFEKMLYDNALLALAYTEAHQATGRQDFARVAREVLDYVLREMTSPEGAFYSATDADSEGEEGKFFVWSLGEIRSVLGPDAERFIRHYGVIERGNFEGENILFVQSPSEEEWAALKPARDKLYEVRRRRVPPLRDDKILAAWNGLMISALSVAGRVLGEARYVEAAARAADFILGNMRPSGRLSRSWLGGESKVPGFLDDHAFLGQGLVDLFEATFEPRWLRVALSLAETLEARFADRAHGGWFMTGDDQERLIAREKPAYDGAEPAGSSVALMLVLRLAALTGEDRWRQTAERALSAYADDLGRRPVALAEMLLALDMYTEGAREVVLVWPEHGPGPEALLEVIRGAYAPNKVLAGAPEGPALSRLAEVAPIVAGKRAIDGRPTAYVCEQGRCLAPTTDPATLAAELGKAAPLKLVSR
jgi:hypothetical protein